MFLKNQRLKTLLFPFMVLFLQCYQLCIKFLTTFTVQVRLTVDCLLKTRNLIILLYFSPPFYHIVSLLSHHRIFLLLTLRQLSNRFFILQVKLFLQFPYLLLFLTLNLSRLILQYECNIDQFQSQKFTCLLYHSTSTRSDSLQLFKSLLQLLLAACLI